MFSIQPIVDAIKSENPELSDNMATACALLAMRDFRERIKVTLGKQLPGTYIATPYRAQDVQAIGTDRTH
jgi:hypothetical protein